MRIGRSTLHDLLETDNSIGISEPIAVITLRIIQLKWLTYTDYIHTYMYIG